MKALVAARCGLFGHLAPEKGEAMSTRIRINLTFEADLDQVPGWGDKPEDWIDLIKSNLERNAHYHTKVTVNRVEGLTRLSHVDTVFNKLCDMTDEEKSDQHWQSNTCSY